MLRLARATDPAWVQGAWRQFDDVLLDHAHCEKKAASTAINLIFRYQDRVSMLVPLSEVAREELAHFELVLGLLARRGVTFCKQRQSPYASELHKAVRKGEPERLLDLLLCCALIEARSCERMRLLSEHLPDAELAAFYGRLLASEARHFALYTELACRFFDAEEVWSRLAVLADHEAEVIGAAPPMARLHAN